MNRMTLRNETSCRRSNRLDSIEVFFVVVAEYAEVNIGQAAKVMRRHYRHSRRLISAGCGRRRSSLGDEHRDTATREGRTCQWRWYVGARVRYSAALLTVGAGTEPVRIFST